jgi:hypothetical protein
VIISVPSIQATGSHTLVYELLKSFDPQPYRFKPLNKIATSKVDNTVYHGHITLEDRRWTESYLSLPTIIPLRHPLVTAHTHEQKKNNIDELVEQFTYMSITYPNAYYLPMDLPRPRRDTYIDKINNDLGLSFPYEFPTIKSQFGNDTLRRGQVTRLQNQAKVENLVVTIEPWITKLYG